MMYGNGAVLLSLFFIRLFYYFAIYDYNPCKGSSMDLLGNRDDEILSHLVWYAVYAGKGKNKNFRKGAEGPESVRASGSPQEHL